MPELLQMAGRIATEVCRMEIVAEKTSGVFALDKVDFEKQPRSQRVSKSYPSPS